MDLGMEYEAKGPWHRSAGRASWTDYHMYRTVLIFQAGRGGDTGEAAFDKGVSQCEDLRPFIGPCVHYDYDFNWLYGLEY